VVSGGIQNIAYGDASTISGGSRQFAQTDGEHLP
jgi:hypothetical protein